jgi:pilus assembly protein CpaE
LKLARVNVIVVDLEESREGLRCLQFLAGALPDVMLIAIGGDESGLIIEAMRAGVREYIRKDNLAELGAALKRVDSKARAAREGDRDCRMFAVVGAKGGAGATTAAINLSFALHASGDDGGDVRVGLIDFASPLGDVGAHLNLKPEFGIEDALKAGPRLDAELLETYMVSVDGVSILPGRQSLAFRPEESNLGRIGSDGTERLLEVARDNFDVLIVDLGTQLGTRAAEDVLRQSDTVSVVFTSDFPSLWRAVRVGSYMEGSGVGSRSVFVLNRWRKNDSISNGEIEKVLRQKVYWSLPNDFSAVAQAVGRGQSLASSRSSLSHSYRELAMKLAGTEKPKRRGVLSLLG